MAGGFRHLWELFENGHAGRGVLTDPKTPSGFTAPSAVCSVSLSLVQAGGSAPTCAPNVCAWSGVHRRTLDTILSPHVWAAQVCFSRINRAGENGASLLSPAGLV